MNYIIVIEIENLGFVFKSKLSQEKIMAYIHNVFFKFQNYDIENLHNLKNLILIDRYQIYGNQMYLGKGELGQCNGFVTASLILIKPDFCLKTLIRERENYSIPFDYEKHFEQIDNLFELYPRQIISAN